MSDWVSVLWSCLKTTQAAPLAHEIFKPEGEDTHVPGMTEVKASHSTCQSSTR